MYSFCWTPVALKNAIVTCQITYSSFMPQHRICYRWWISKNMHKNFYASSQKEEHQHRPWSFQVARKKEKKSTKKIHQNPPKSTPAWKNLPNKKTGTLMWDFKKEVLSDSARASTLVLHGNTHQHWVVESSAGNYSTQMRLWQTDIKYHIII